MGLSQVRTKVGKTYKKLKKRVPYRLTQEEDGIKLQHVDPSFNPKKHENRVYLCIVDGMHTVVKEVDKNGDDMVLEYDGDKYCAITSRPLIIEGNQLYFTRHSYLGTIALNKETLLGADVWQKSAEGTTRKISKDINFDRLDFDVQAKSTGETEDYYKVKNEDIGDIASLSGSKKTLKDVNEAKRLRKLLQPSSMDKKKLLMAVGSGVALGIYLYPYVMQG